jgi:hypothetical protein
MTGVHIGIETYVLQSFFSKLLIYMQLIQD